MIENINENALLHDIKNTIKYAINIYNKEELENEIYEILESYIDDKMIDDFRVLSIEENFIRLNDGTGVEREVIEVSLSITISADPNNFIEKEILVIEDI